MKMSSSVPGICLLSLVGVAPVFAQSDRLGLLDAVKLGDHTAINQALDRKADVNITAPDGTTALHWAAERADVATVARLVAGGANVRAANATA